MPGDHTLGSIGQKSEVCLPVLTRYQRWRLKKLAYQYLTFRDRKEFLKFIENGFDLVATATDLNYNADFRKRLGARLYSQILPDIIEGARATADEELIAFCRQAGLRLQAFSISNWPKRPADMA